MSKFSTQHKLFTLYNEQLSFYGMGGTELTSHIDISNDVLSLLFVFCNHNLDSSIYLS